MQTTFLLAVRALERGVEPDCEPAWLHAIAKNVCRSQRRSALRRPVAGDVELDSLAAPEPAEDAELLVGLRDALRSVPPRQRRALVRREWQGIPPREIATELELSAPATHALLTRARQALGQALIVPRRSVFGLGWLAYELRSWVKAAFGSASAKVAVAAVAVVGTGVGGVVVDQTVAGDRGSRGPGESARHAPATPAGGDRVGGASRPSAVDSSEAGRAPAARRRGAVVRGSATAPASGPQLASGTLGTIPRRTRPGSTPTAGPVPASPRERDSRVTDPLAGVPLLPLAPPELPPVDLPPVEPPPVDVPPVDLPTDLLPSVDLPPVDLPPVDPPPVPLLP